MAWYGYGTAWHGMAPLPLHSGTGTCTCAAATRRRPQLSTLARTHARTHKTRALTTDQTSLKYALQAAAYASLPCSRQQVPVLHCSSAPRHCVSLSARQSVSLPLCPSERLAGRLSVLLPECLARSVSSPPRRPEPMHACTLPL